MLQYQFIPIDQTYFNVYVKRRQHTMPRLVAEILSISNRRFRPNIPQLPTIKYPTFARSLPAMRSFATKLIRTYIDELAKLSPSHAEAESGAENLMLPQVALSSGWAFRPTHPARWTPALASLEFLKYQLTLGIGHLPSPREAMIRSFRIDKSHKGPTNSSGYDSFFFTWHMARTHGFGHYPNMANYRHGVKGSSYYAVNSFLTGDLSRLVDAPLPRLVIMIPLLNSLLMRPYADALTVSKGVFGSGKLLLDAAYIVEALTERSVLRQTMTDQPTRRANSAPNELDWSLPKLREDWFVAAGDYTAYDQHIGPWAIAAVTAAAYEILGPQLFPSEDYGLGPYMAHPVSWQSQIRSVPFWAPAGVDDPFASMLTLTPSMLLSGQPDTAGTGSLVNYALQHEAAAYAYQMPLSLLYHKLRECDERDCERFVKVRVFSDDSLIAARHNVDGFAWAEDRYWAFFEHAGYIMKKDALSFLRHHIIPGVGVVPHWTRRFARSIDPEYGYHNDETLAQLASIGKFAGMTPEGGFHNVDLPEGLREAAGRLRKVIFTANGLTDLRYADADAYSIGLATKLASAKQALLSMNAFELEQLADRTPSAKAILEGIIEGRSVKLTDWNNTDFRERALTRASLFDLELLPEFRMPSELIIERTLSAIPNVKL